MCFAILMPMRQICTPNVDILVFFEKLIGVSAFLSKIVNVVLRQECRTSCFVRQGIRVT